jgi:hypothetical protein
MSESRNLKGKGLWSLCLGGGGDIEAEARINNI